MRPSAPSSSTGLAGAAIESVVPAAVASLSRRVARTLVLSRVGVAAVMVVMAAAGFSIGLAATMRPDEKPQRGPAMEKPGGGIEKAGRLWRARDVTGEPMVIRGQVLDPDGKPAAGADIFFRISRMNADDGGGARRVGTAGPDGRFELTIPDPTIDPQPVRVAKPPLIGVVTATARGFGPAWAAIHPSSAGSPIALKLRRDDVPIEGRIVSLEGRPIPGVTVNVELVNEFSPALINEMRQNGGQIGAAPLARGRDGFLCRQGRPHSPDPY